jgi:hypothetical protein
MTTTEKIFRKADTERILKSLQGYPKIIINPALDVHNPIYEKPCEKKNKDYPITLLN